METKTQPSKKRDFLFPLMRRAYFRTNLAANEKVTMNDLVLFAKTYLAKKTNTLAKSPIWDAYTDEEMLVEYFSHLFAENEDFKKSFEEENGLVDTAVYDWLDAQVLKNQVDMKKQLDSMEENISFVPLGGE